MVKKTSVNISQHSKALHILVMTTDTEAGTDRGHVIRMAKPPGALCLHSGSASGRLGICWHALPNVSSFPNQAVIFFFSGNSSLIQLLKSITPESDIYSPHAILCCVLHFLFLLSAFILVQVNTISCWDHCTCLLTGLQTIQSCLSQSILHIAGFISTYCTSHRLLRFSFKTLLLWKSWPSE